MWVNSYDPNAERPKVGEIWTWRPKDRAARCLVEVTEVLWNGEEWFVKTRTIEPSMWLNGNPAAPWNDYVGKECWNDLGNFMSAAKKGHHGRAWTANDLLPQSLRTAPSSSAK